MGFSVWQILIVLALVLLLFGTKKLRSAGGDLGGAVQGFRRAIRDDTEQGSDMAANGEGAAAEKDRTIG